MDPCLLRDRESFQKMAIALPRVEKKVRPQAPAPSTQKNDFPRKSRTAPKLDCNTYKTLSGSSQYRFGVLAKIVKYMRSRYQEGDDYPLTLDEILDETNQLDVGMSVKNWLSNEALRNNPKIELCSDGVRFNFKPTYKLKDGKSLMKLLKQHDNKGLGGVLLDDIQESLPHFEKTMKHRASDITFITRPTDKKKIAFYRDRGVNLTVDEEFQKIWRTITVDAMDELKIDDYLKKQGIRSMQDQGVKKTEPKRKKPALKKRSFKKPRDNEHLADVLETYDDNNLTNKVETK